MTRNSFGEHGEHEVIDIRDKQYLRPCAIKEEITVFQLKTRVWVTVGGSLLFPVFPALVLLVLPAELDRSLVLIFTLVKCLQSFSVSQALKASPLSPVSCFSSQFSSMPRAGGV